MAPTDDTPSLEEQEAKAKIELLAIHPNVRAKIVEIIGFDAWKAMSIVEKLDAVMKKLPEVGDNVTEEWEKDLARNVATSVVASANAPTDVSEPEPDDAPVLEEPDSGPRYWAPAGRCPYGLDRGSWVINDEELKQHNSAHSCWICIDGEIYDVTEFLNQHPGGAARLLEFAGGDASSAFKAIGHSATAVARREEFHIGRFDDPEQNAKRELIAIHPSIRAEIVQTIPSEEWVAKSFSQKLDFVKQRMPDVKYKVMEDFNFLGDVAKTDPFQTTASTGRCPYGFDQVEGGDVPEVSTEADSEAKSAICPISGKSGTCPVQAMQKNQQTTVQAPPTDAKVIEGESKPAVCPISGKTGTCPAQAMHKSNQTMAPSPSIEAKKTQRASKSGEECVIV